MSGVVAMSIRYTGKTEPSLRVIMDVDTTDLLLSPATTTAPPRKRSRLGGGHAGKRVWTGRLPRRPSIPGGQIYCSDRNVPDSARRTSARLTTPLGGVLRRPVSNRWDYLGA